MPHPLIEKTGNDFKKAFLRLQEEYGKLQVGRASSSLVEQLMVEAYGTLQPLKALASVSVPDARTVQIQPWDRSLLAAIEKAIQNSDLNLNPVNNGLAIILNIPSLTEERRRDLVKLVRQLAEEAKIVARNLRHEAMTTFKRMEHESEMTEDDRIGSEKAVQEAVDKLNKEIDDLAKKKEESLMTL